MKKFTALAAAAAIAIAAAAPVAAQDANTNDPFVGTAGPDVLPLIIIGGAAALIIGVAASSGTD